MRVLKAPLAPLARLPLPARRAASSSPRAAAVAVAAARARGRPGSAGRNRRAPFGRTSRRLGSSSGPPLRPRPARRSPRPARGRCRAPDRRATASWSVGGLARNAWVAFWIRSAAARSGRFVARHHLDRLDRAQHVIAPIRSPRPGRWRAAREAALRTRRLMALAVDAVGFGFGQTPDAVLEVERASRRRRLRAFATSAARR